MGSLGSSSTSTLEEGSDHSDSGESGSEAASTECDGDEAEVVCLNLARCLSL